MRSIIVGTDFSEGSYVALDMAVTLAKKLDCGVKVVWAKRDKMLMDDDQQTMLCNLAEEKLKSLCEKYKDMLPAGAIRWEICPGKVGAVMVRQARHESAPLILIGTNGASGFEKYFMGSTAVRIVQEAPVPVLTVRQGFNYKAELEKIVLPIRYNISSRQKVPAAASLAKFFGSEIHILGLYDDNSQMPNAQAYVNQTAEFLEKEGVKYVKLMQKYSVYSDAVLGYADSIQAGLVVINTEQDKFLSQYFIGTNAQQIVHNSQIPVLCVHPADIFFLSKT